MARKTILSPYYTFTPSTKTILIPQPVLRERIQLITNVTTNQVIYNFSDSNLKFTSYSITTDSIGNTFTTVVLQYNTAGMSATDRLEIIVDDFNETFQPAETQMDPVNKLRVSNPQALIDTDFEYSVQATKWESVAMINNRPFAYFNVNSPLTITDVTATNGSRTITVNTTTPPAAGTPVYILDTTFAGADGLFIVDSIVAGTSFSYTAKIRFTGTTGSIFVSGTTSAYQGTVYTGAAIGISSITNSGTAVTITTSVPHGLALGNELALTGTSASTNAPNGSWVVSTVTSPTVFSFQVTNAPTGSITGGTLYCRPTGTFNHRPFDGGVTFSTNAQSHNQQMIRQTRRYFRYQSGKGIQISTGTLLKPSINIDGITSSGTTVTVTTKIQHNLNPGVTIQVSRCNEPAYNGSFVVATVLDPYKFTYTALSAPSTSPASGPYVLSVTGWNGAQVRVGSFDSQNGIFFEYDGSTLFAVRRSSTYQLSGFVSVTVGSSTVTGQTVNGVTTLFSKQLQPNDFIVIRGMSYRVENINSDTSMTIQPAYRGAANLSNVIVSKTTELRIPQSQWNIDRLDGAGPSGFTIDLSRMQMFYMDYSWYGAGFIRWGVRGATGDVIYCHKLINNNINYDAYMRSGNLPARYEAATFARTSLLTSTMSNTDTTINVSDHSNWATAGTIWVRNASQSEFINYTGKSQVASLTGTTVSGSAVISMASTTGVVVGQYVQGTGIPYGATVQSIATNTSVTISQVATFSATSTIIFGPTLTGLTRTQAGGTLTFTTTANSPTMTGVSTAGVQIGQYISGTNIPPGAYVVSFVTNTSVTMSEGATGSGSISVIFSPMGQTTAQTFTYNAVAPTVVESHAPEFAPTISHWGTSVIMDGRFDDDKSFVFTRGMTTALSVNSGVNNAIMSFRVAPTVSNGVTSSTLGTRELINRMQMVLRNLDCFSNGQFLITLVLNGTVSSATPNWTSQGGSSLAQYIIHSASTTLTGGEVVYGFFLNTAGGTTNFTTTSFELALLRDLGNSILGGGAAAANAAIYPDGPDIITIMAQNIGVGSSNILARVSWTEAQA